MEEFKQFLIEHGILDTYCKVIVDPIAKSTIDMSVNPIDFKHLLDHPFNWARAERVYPSVSEDSWENLSNKWRSTDPKGRYNGTRENLVKLLLHKDKKLFLLNQLKYFK